MGRKATSLASLLSKTIYDEKTGCRIWQGNLALDGRYGSVSYKNKTVRVHRLIYKLVHGEISDDLGVLHNCDRPLCIEPSHLFTGTDADNMADKVAKNRQAKGEYCNHPHQVLNEEKVKEIRKLRASGVLLEDLATIFGCAKSNIFSVVNYKTWRHVI